MNIKLVLQTERLWLPARNTDDRKRGKGETYRIKSDDIGFLLTNCLDDFEEDIKRSRVHFPRLEKEEVEPPHLSSTVQMKTPVIHGL